ncbi:MAG: CBU_0592 family membrane protein [bacterium]
MNFGEMGWPDLVGFCGVVLLIGAYAALQFGKIEAEDPAYSLANAAAALLILFSLFYHFNAASFTIEIFWLLISIIGLARSLRK